MRTQKFNIVTAQSKIDWVGKKVTGAHNGTINLKDGEITSVQGDQVEGDLTIKGITNPVVFDIKATINDDTFTATGKIVIDRTKYGIKFRSGNFFQNLGDTLIYNDFELNVLLTAKAVEEAAHA